MAGGMRPGERDLLLVVDVRNDFRLAGSLARTWRALAELGVERLSSEVFATAG